MCEKSRKIITDLTLEETGTVSDQRSHQRIAASRSGNDISVAAKFFPCDIQPNLEGSLRAELTQVGNLHRNHILTDVSCRRVRKKGGRIKVGGV